MHYTEANRPGESVYSRFHDFKISCFQDTVHDNALSARIDTTVILRQRDTRAGQRGRPSLLQADGKREGFKCYIWTHFQHAVTAYGRSSAPAEALSNQSRARQVKFRYSASDPPWLLCNYIRTCMGSTASPGWVALRRAIFRW